MNRRREQELQAAESELESAEAELDELNRQIQSFESLVDARLGSLLDQLSQLNVETISLDEQLRHIREQRLFGSDLLSYLDGAPRPARPLDLTGLPPFGILHRGGTHPTAGSSSTSPEPRVPDIKMLYRQLARRYHPDLARNDADRLLSNEQMKVINQAYNAGDLHALMRLAGIDVLYGANGQQPPHTYDLPNEPMTDLKRVNRKLQSVRLQITRLSRLPTVKLSLDVKLAHHQGRDLLGEMAAELQYKLARKLAERDYLCAQIKASGEIDLG